MSGHHHGPSRHSPPQLKKSAIKTSRSAPSSKHSPRSKVTIQAAKAPKNSRDEKDEDIFCFEEDDEMATSFLQYCAMCEKQILSHNSSILYCSESCRRRDACPTPTTPHPALTLRTSNRQPPPQPIMNEPSGKGFPTYVPALIPTPRHAKDTRKPPVFHEGKSDLDPTEWKPSEPRPPATTKEKDDHDAFPGFETSPRTSTSTDSFPGLSKHRSPRPLTLQSRRTSRTAPSLSHSPATASVTSSDQSLLSSTPLEFVTRPTIAGVTTTTGPTAAVGKGGEGDVVEVKGMLSYEKQIVGATGGGKGDRRGSARGSLKKLLGVGR